MPKKLNLQFFSKENPEADPHDEPNGQPAGQNTPTSGQTTPPAGNQPPAGTSTPNSGQDAVTGNSEPPKTPSAEEIKANILKELGVSDLDTAKNSLKSFKELQDKNKTELQKAQDQAKSAADQLAQAQAQNTVLNTKNMALGKGVRADALDDVVKLVSGEKDVGKALDGVLKKYPQFGAQQQQRVPFGQSSYQNLGGSNGDAFIAGLKLNPKIRTR